ncbi:hypothetical protein UlMin_029598 [Ulmus minor]
MSLRSRATPTGETTSVTATAPPENAKPPPQRRSSFSQRAVSQTLTTTANLANLLPTGTLLAFQLLTPIFTSNGSGCDAATRPLTAILLGLLALSCFLASFTDSVKATDGQFRIRFIDWVHAVLSVFVFGAVALRDKNVLTCFYPKPRHETQEVLDIVPVGIGIICGLLFVVFPTRRHGIGYPLTPGK